MRRSFWREDVMLPPSINVSSYCKACKTYTYWKRGQAIAGYGYKVISCLKCSKCGRSVTTRN